MTRATKQPLASDLRNLPAYTYVEAARALNIPASTIGAWVRGQQYRTKDGMGYFEPLIVRPDPRQSGLSFTNLIEAHVLRSLRTSHEIKMRQVREALEVAEQRHGIERLLIHKDLRFRHAGQLFLEEYARLVPLTRSQQLVMREMFDLYLERVEYDESDLPKELYPLTRGPKMDSPKIIALNPYISFGRSIIRRVGISTAAIRARIDAGETKKHVAQDYHLRPEEVDEALRYEVAA